VLAPAAVGGTKSVSGTFSPGGTVTYTVVLTNSGGAAQSDNPGDEFTDVLPAQLSLVSASATAGTVVAAVATNTVTWNGSIPAGGSVTITIQASINPGTAGGSVVSNQGTVSFDADGNGVNETTALTSTASFDLVVTIPTLNTPVFALLAVLLALISVLLIRRSRPT
jgi:uncharacterized repeat protein (TIGR01451 family)